MRISKWACTVFIAFLLIPTLSEGQIPPRPSTITVFLADSDMGVAGVCQGSGQTLYFEAATPRGSTQLSARLLDVDGRTIAISGHSMDSTWLGNTAYDSTIAAQSLTLASYLASHISLALPGGTAFSRESRAISNLATGAAQAGTSTTMVTIDSATSISNLPTLTPDMTTAAVQYDATDNQAMVPVRDIYGNLNVAYTGANLQTYVLNFPDQEDEDTGQLGVTEISAALFLANGTSVGQQIGGEDIPTAWYDAMFPSTPPSFIDAIQLAIDAGKAIRGAALLERYSSFATAAEKDALDNVARNVRNNSLFPVPLASGCAGSAYYSRDAIWKKPTAGRLAEHSGTIVRQGACNGRGSIDWYGHTIYCNHGTCPGKDPMKYKCMATAGPLSSPHYAPHARIPSGQPGAGGLHSCYKTKYDLLSGLDCIITGCNPGHNCHDDSWTQLRAIKGESYHLTGGARCNETTFYKTSPNCTD